MDLWDCLLYSAYNVCADILFIIKYPFNYKMLRKNRELKNRHKGKRCFVVMNGSSLNRYHLENLKNEYVICANYMYRTPIAETISPNYYCWLDSTLFKTGEAETVIKDIKMKFPDIKIILNMRGYRYFEGQKELYYTYNKHLPSTFGVRCNLSGNSSGYMTVAWYAVGAAIYMGFKDIFILGLDFEPTGFKHFSEEGGKQEDARKRKDICGFYFSFLKAHSESLALAKYAKKHDIRIINCNHDSYIRAFPFYKCDKAADISEEE